MGFSILEKSFDQSYYEIKEAVSNYRDSLFAYNLNILFERA